MSRPLAALALTAALAASCSSSAPSGGVLAVSVPPELPVTTTTAPATTTTHAPAPRAARSVTRPRPTPTVAAPLDASGCSDWRVVKTRAQSDACWGPLVARYPWPQAWALRVLYCESKGSPFARNRSGATGLMQILGGPTDPEANIALAYSMYARSGTRPWVCK